MLRQHGGATVVLIAAFAAVGCQTERPALQTPPDRGEQQPARTMLADSDDVLQRIRTGLAHEPLLADARIRVDAQRGTVRLRGVVHDGIQQARAIEIARGIPGVRNIQNELIRHGRSGVAEGPLPHAQLQL